MCIAKHFNVIENCISDRNKQVPTIVLCVFFLRVGLYI